jgi:hypothetical protein
MRVSFYRVLGNTAPDSLSLASSAVERREEEAQQTLDSARPAPVIACVRPLPIDHDILASQL